ncbi:MAG: hypothetical protein WDN75_12955 [Bacteroidota bacterium]
MEQGYSVETKIPAGFTPAHDFFLFNDTNHLKLQADEWLHIYLLKRVTQKIMAQVSFHIRDHRALTPFRAPFGSFSYSQQLSPLLLYQFIQECENLLKKRNVGMIVIKEPPLSYRTNGELLHTILLNLGYKVELAEVSTGITVDQSFFEEKIASGEKGKLMLAKRKGFLFKKIPLSELENVYNFILTCRTQRDQSLSMTFEQLAPTVESFKNSFVLSGVYLQKEMVAAAISIHINSWILYNFYLGHLKKFDSVSPAVMLINGIYKYCKSNQVKLLDLGTSALEGQPNFSLLDFKLRLGSVPSMKLTFEKKLT